MKRLVCLVSMLLVLQTSMAQEQARAYVVDNGFNLWNKQIGDTAYVFADKALIRDYPSLEGKILDSLTNGSAVIIKSEPYNPSTIRGFNTPWHKISYTQNNQNKEGYIWLGLLGLGRHASSNGGQFIHGFLRHDKETSYSEAAYLLEIKYLDKYNNLLSRKYFPVNILEQSYTDSKILPHMGLSGLESIHRIGFYGEACGVPTTHYYFSWNGKEFETMFHKTSVGDAGIYYYEETILFPSEHKLADNLIIKDIEEGEVIDETALEPKFKIKRKREKYNWDGKFVSQIIEMK